MACEEARQLLDALMGGDRNAPLPPGAAMPRSKKKRKQTGGGGEMLLLPGKRSKSCYDNDIDPLYCAWGIDVFELFVNTKSDIGPNPYVVDEGARQEFSKLPPPEQERLGFNYFLFQKLQELVRSGDRTVQRNKEKLAQELRRLAAKRGANPANQPVVDYVQDVDEQAIEALARNQLEFDFLHNKLQTELLIELEKIVKEEDDLKTELSKLLREQREKDEQQQKEKEKEKEKEGGEEDKKEGEGEETKVKQEEEGKVKQEEETETKEEETTTTSTSNETSAAEEKKKIQSLQIDLGKLTLQKQRVLWDTAKVLSQVAPLQEQMDGQLRNLLYVKSDIAADKTVCEVSGNFMSARDADERIAAHYAGKQYVGWKLVREKFKEMIAKYGRYGPPPPDRSGGNRGGPGGPPGGGPPMGMHRGGGGGGGPPRGSGGGYGRGGGGYGDRGGGGYGDRGGGGGRGRGRYDGGGGGWGGDRGGGDRGGRWERHGPNGPPGYDRRGGNRGGGWRR